MTKKPFIRPSMWKGALKFCLGTAAVFAIVLSLNAQETIGSNGKKIEAKSVPEMPPVKDPEGKKSDPKNRPVADQPGAELPGRAPGTISRARSIVRQGYTRPGNPTDAIDPRTGKILPIAVDTMKVLGATVYFAVYERSGLGDNDTWGAGMTNFDSRFVEGQNFQGGFSPRLDTRSKYLYVYQIVNDRLLEPHKNKTVLAVDGGEKNLSAEDISTFYLKLLVDPRYITSWGHFRGVGFTAEVANRDQTGEIKPIADGVTTDIRLAVSSNPSIVAELPNLRFARRAPAYALQQLGNSFGLGSSTMNIAKTTYFQDLEAKAKTNPNKLVAYEKNIIVSAAHSNEPTFAQLMYFSGEERVEGAANIADEDIARAIFRVDFKGDQIVKQGQHSVVFGFTTDLAPTDEPIRIATRAGAAALGNGVRQVAFDGDGEGAGVGAGEGVGAGSGLGLAVGTAPTPGPAPAAAEGGGSGGGSVSAGLGGMAGGIGGGVGGLGGGVGGIGAARGATMGGGGGFGGGTGGGTGNGDANTKPGQNQTGTTGSTINFTATLVNQQQQKRNQSQQQKSINNNNNCCNGGNVVPAPASLLLGLLGLPCLYFLRRSRKETGEIES